jgi:hypothetical protein
MSASPWSDFEMAPPDAIMELNKGFDQDDQPNGTVISCTSTAKDRSTTIDLGFHRFKSATSMSASHVDIMHFHLPGRS